MSDNTDSERQTYRLVRGDHYHKGERLERGDTFEPSDTEIQTAGHKLEPVADTGSAVNASTETAEASAPDTRIPTPEDHNFPGGFDNAEAFVDRTPLSKVVEDLESGDYDGHLDAIEAAAERQGVLDEVAERRE